MDVPLKNRGLASLKYSCNYFELLCLWNASIECYFCSLICCVMPSAYFPHYLVIQLFKKLEHEVAIVFLEWKICIHSQFISWFSLVKVEGGGETQQRTAREDLKNVWFNQNLPGSYLFLNIPWFLKVFFWQTVDIGQLWRSLICSSQRLMVNLVKVKTN